MGTDARLSIGLDSAGMLISPDEFDAITDYDELYSYELIHGILVVTPLPFEAGSDQRGAWLSDPSVSGGPSARRGSQ
jgi:hypothetical protein